MHEINQDNTSLQKLLTHHINQYLSDMKGQNITDMYHMVIEKIEQPLLQVVIEHCKYNQSKAARILGISRGTLRTALKKYFDDKYCGAREQ